MGSVLTHITYVFVNELTQSNIDRIYSYTYIVTVPIYSSIRLDETYTMVGMCYKSEKVIRGERFRSKTAF